MKNIIRFIPPVLAGCILGFFGVLVSVFADGALIERWITICIILLIYFTVCGLLGFFMPKDSWEWGVCLSFPGVILLGLYMRSEFNPFYIIYMILIIFLSCLGAYVGSEIRNKKANKKTQ